MAQSQMLARTNLEHPLNNAWGALMAMQMAGQTPLTSTLTMNEFGRTPMKMDSATNQVQSSRMIAPKCMVHLRKMRSAAWTPMVMVGQILRIPIPKMPPSTKPVVSFLCRTSTSDFSCCSSPWLL